MQSIIEEKVAAILQRKDNAKHLKKRYTKEMKVKMDFLFSRPEQQTALLLEQRLIKLEDICRAAGVQVGQYEVSPYLDEIKDEIEITYPQDILTIIAEKRMQLLEAALQILKMKQPPTLLYHLLKIC